MSSRSTKTLRSPRGRRHWVVRGVLAAILALLGVMSVSASTAQIIRSANPRQALSLAPNNGTILAAAADAEFMERFDVTPTSTAARLARSALIQDPTAVKALSVLGFQAFLRGERGLSDRIFAYSMQLSRRELRSLVWAVEKAVERGDIRLALQNYDLALRTSGEAKDALFPTLAAALSSPEIRSTLLTVLRTEPAWTKDFIVFAAISGVDPDSALRFFQEGASTGLPVDNDNRAGLVNAFAQQGEYESAWAYYASFRPEANRRRSRDPQFRLSTDARAVFDWASTDDPNVSAAILPSPEGGRLEFFAPPATGGIAVQQKQVLPEGNYRLRGRAEGIEQPRSSAPYWALTCEDGREFQRIEVVSGEQPRGTFTVPPGCPVQTLALVIRPTDSITGATGQITSVEIEP